ncbi:MULTISPECIES: TetR/AcrR family transcriptional regulator [Deinococcus]|uniref:TetR/AcrR family transcriptional regulator n=1 Tax=Deinococcus rufus TaxID=2136097 RepID=A0ABV7Z5D8_9DEIO|nr:TetR/AcrR family transcriptional regulator [Deinococcus sp. AB2017081]WQE95110.1 TetR/AcrR family transcriptional regulator [Deinococcus sp. AB2017081]
MAQPPPVISPSSPPPDRSATNPRVQRSRTTILATTLDLLTESGLGGVSIDEVSRRSGIAKTTIYRHWPTRADLLTDACAQLIDRQDIPDTGDVRRDLTTQLTTLAHLLTTARWSTVLPSVIDAAERDPGIADILSRIQRGHMAPFREIMTRARTRGELPPDADHSALTAQLMGPLFYRRWFTREPLDDAFVQMVIDTVLGRQSTQ